MKTKPPFDGEIHAVSAKNMPDLSSPKREPGWFLGEPAPQTTPTRDEAVREIVRAEILKARMEPTDLRSLQARIDSAVAKLPSAPAPASGGVDAVMIADLRHLAKFLKGERGYFLRDVATRLETLGSPTSGILVWMKEDDNGALSFSGKDTGDCRPMNLDDLTTELRARAAALELVKEEFDRTFARASLSPAATPVSEAGGEVEQLKAYRDELLKIAADVGEPDDPFAAWEAIAALKALAKPASSPAGGDVREALDWLAGFNAYRAGPCAQDVRTAFISGWMHRAEQEAALSQSTSAGRVGE